MKTLIIGGSGFIGIHVVTALLAHGHEVSIFSRGIAKPPFPSTVNFINGEHKDLPHFKEELAEHHFDVVIDMIAYSAKDAQDFIDTFAGIVPKELGYQESSPGLEAMHKTIGWLKKHGNFSISAQEKEELLLEEKSIETFSTRFLQEA